MSSKKPNDLRPGLCLGFVSETGSHCSNSQTGLISQSSDLGFPSAGM